jgi:2-keto-3-deoxy-6-phosphogluconate aldolase
MSSESSSDIANKISSVMAQKAADTTDGLSTALNTMASAISGSSDNKNISTSIANIVTNKIDMSTLQTCVKGGMSQTNVQNYNFNNVVCGPIVMQDQTAVVSIVSKCMLSQTQYSQALTDLANSSKQDVTLKQKGVFDFIANIIGSMGQYTCLK